MVAVSEEWPAIPELKEIWFAMLGDFTTRLARMIESERAAGAAPQGADARALAASLVWTAERAFHVAVGGDHPTLVDAAGRGGAAGRSCSWAPIYGPAPCRVVSGDAARAGLRLGDEVALQQVQHPPEVALGHVGVVERGVLGVAEQAPADGRRRALRP